MGNLFPLRILKNPCFRLSICRTKNILQVVKMDGELIEFTKPLLVKELLMSFEDFVVKSSRKSPNHLPPSFRLQLGKTYYLLPLKKSPNHAADVVSAKAEPDQTNTSSSVKRIKVVITKKQLQELLSNKTSVENIIFGIDSKPCSRNSDSKPRLTPIPEENELNI